MNSYERVMDALNGQPVDRPPVLAILGFYGANLTGTPVDKLYRDADLYVAAQKAIIDTFGIDMALPPFEFSLLAEAFNGGEQFFSNQAPNMNRPPAANISEALALPLPDSHTTARLPFVLETTRKLSAIYHLTLPIFATLPGPASLPVLMMGMETWLETILFDEAAARELLERTGRFWVQWANAQFEAGADVLVVPEGMATRTVTTRDLFQEQLLPHIHICFEQVNGPVIFHHSGGTINHMIDLVPGLPNLVGIGIGSTDNLYEAREKIGPGIPLFGNIDNLSFRSLSADQIRAQATACLNAGKEIGPIILCNAGADLPIDTPPENIHALCEAAKAFATCPALETLWICCGVVTKEVEELHRRGDIQGELGFLNSMLHMNPLQLEHILEEQLQDSSRPVVLIYGDCCPGMLQLIDRPGVSRVDGINCCQVLLGKERYKELMRDETFIMLPEWTSHWKAIIEQELGLHGEIARDLFRESRKGLVYLDTGLAPVPEKELNECSVYTGLPLRVEPINLNRLKTALLKAEKTAQKSLRKTKTI